MITRAKIKYLKISPRKLRLVLPLIKKKTVPVALSILENMNKKAAKVVYKAVHSAAANAKRFPNINENDLYISKIFADGGPMLKRFRAQPMGVATTIRKRMSHLTVELDALARPKKEVKKVQKVQKPKEAKRQKPLATPAFGRQARGNLPKENKSKLEAKK